MIDGALVTLDEMLLATCAYFCIVATDEAGCDAFTLVQLLGHSDVRVTMGM
jgi:hypothetical protein